MSHLMTTRSLRASHALLLCLGLLGGMSQAGCFGAPLDVVDVENECVVDPGTLSIIEGVEIRTGNGVDDDGDGVRDEFCSCPYDMKPAGVCRQGVIDARVQVCRRPQNQYPVEVTLCDGLDNDCDGLADELCKCNVGDNSVGVCALGRVMTDGACFPPEFYEQDEALCDGYDNDCDNQTDENCMLCDFQGNLEGVCRYGRPDAERGLCLPPLNFALDEQECGVDPLAGDAVDNDCDGFVDEGCACPFKNSVFGVCSVGKRAAPSDCLAPNNYEEDEISCDGLDNDCDGDVDEGCSRTIVISNCISEEERCDGVDNDCDGLVDESCTCNYARNDTGVCSNGILSERSGLCLPPQSFEALELSCDGLDNDCNGQVDENCGKDFIKMATGDAHTCGILEDGNVRCWGRNAWNIHKVPEGQTFQKIDAGRFHTCGLSTNNDVFCWGGNEFGQAVSNMKNARDIASGSFHSCGLDTNGSPVCWGSDRHGQSTATGSGFTQLTAGEYHTCGLLRDGSVTCWGLNDQGQSSPPAGAKFTRITAGHFHTCGLDTSGAVQCWGSNTDGESTPPQNGSSYVEVIASGRYTCALNTAQKLECWGRPPAGDAPDEELLEISAGPLHACGIDAKKRIICWGDNTFRQLAPDSNLYQSISSGQANTCALQGGGLALCWGDDTTAINTPPVVTLTHISVGGAHACGIRADNATPMCWGTDDRGQASPPANLSLAQIASGGSHSCGIKLDGTLACWGDDTNLKTSPPDGTFTQIVASDSFSCALSTDQRVKCWGADLGVGNLDAPVGLFTHVAIGPRNACAISPQGTATCWGEKTFNIHRTSRQSYIELGVGDEYACGITDINELDCWGSTSRPGVLSPPTTDRFIKLTIGAHAAALSRERFILSW